MCQVASWTVVTGEVDRIGRVAVASDGTVFGLGTTAAGDVWVGAYDSDGAEQWTFVFDPAVVGEPDVNETARDLAVLPSGDLIVVLERGSGPRGGIFRLDTQVPAVAWYNVIEDGELDSLPGLGGPLTPTLTSLRVAAASDLGVVVVQGRAELVSQNDELNSNWLSRVAPETGALVWQRWPNPLSQFNGVSPRTLLVDDTVGVVAGFVVFGLGNVSGFDHYGLDGAPLAQYQHSLGQTREISDAALDSAANLAIVYNENTSAVQEPSFCDRRTAADVVISSLTHANEVALGVATDSASNIFAVAVSEGAGVLYQLDLAGDEVWTEEVQEEYWDIKVDTQDAIIVSGRNADDTMGIIRKYGACS